MISSSLSTKAFVLPVFALSVLYLSRTFLEQNSNALDLTNIAITITIIIDNTITIGKKYLDIFGKTTFSERHRFDVML